MISEHPSLFFAIAAWLCWVLGLFVFLSVLRIAQLSGRPIPAPLEARAAANLSNQFEAPMVLLLGVVLLLLEGAITPSIVTALWVFVLGRVLHSVVQIAQSRIVPRGIVFSINFAAICYVWFKLAQHVIMVSA